MRLRRITFIVALLLLAACGGQEPPVEPDGIANSLAVEEAEPTSPPPTEIPPEPTETTAPPTSEPTTTLEPTATAIPPTETPSPTESPTNTPEPEPTAVPPTPIPAVNVPELVWLPYSFGSYGSPILTLDEGLLGYAPEPAPIEIFFDYDGIAGRIAYGSLFFYAAANESDSVTDLWVYDYATKTNEQWLEGDVGRAAWSPAAEENGGPQLAVAIHNGETFDLHLMTAPFQSELIRENIEPYFSWSPDGQRIAYVTADEWVLMESAAVPGPRVETAYAFGIYQNGGWVGDAPLWVSNSDYLIYADNPFTFVNMQMEAFTPVQLDGTPLEQPRPTTMLWSAELRQLIGQIEDFSQNVQIYLLSEDLSTVTDTYFLENSQLIGWYEEGTSIIVLDINQEPQIWSLTEYTYITPE